MPSDKWRRCITCEALVHSACANDLHSWQCPACIASVIAISTETECTPDVNEVCTPDVTEGQLFDTLPDVDAFLKERGYRKNNTQASGVTYKCSHCSKSFYVKKCGHRFSCPLCIDHAPNCTRPVTTTIKAEADSTLSVHPGVQSVRYLHEFSKHPGLLAYIQTMACCGNSVIRQDQLSKGVSALFHVHVEPQLLYRTATKAHEEMFGSSRSDVEELLEMEQRVREQGGFLKLFLGALDCLKVYTL
jgi:hypothetical protein